MLFYNSGNASQLRKTVAEFTSDTLDFVAFADEAGQQSESNGDVPTV